MAYSAFDDRDLKPRDSDLAVVLGDSLEMIDGSDVYAEGRAVRFEVRTREDVGTAVRIAAIKMANQGRVLPRRHFVVVSHNPEAMCLAPH